MNISKRTGPLPALALALSAAAVAVATPAASATLYHYNDFYNHFNSDSSRVKDGQNPPDDIASWAYATNSADAFGGVIGFDGPVSIGTFSVIMSNWNGAGTNSATPGYQTDLTLELYNVDRSGTNPAPGSQILTDTETHDIAGRQVPDAQNASFAGNGTDFVVDWDLGNVAVGDEVLFMVRIDELAPGNSVTNPEVNFLNIAAMATGTPPDVTAGIDTDPGVYWRSDAFTGGQIARFEAGQVMARVGPGADLSITKTDTQDPVVASEQVTYTIEVTNDGPSTAQDVSVTDTPPAEFTFDSVSGATCTANGTVDCDLGLIMSGDTVSFTLTFDIDSSAMGDLVNEVSVDSTTVDPEDGNNEASEDTTVNTEADLSITKTDTPDPVVAGEQVTYSIEVNNNGPSDAQDVEVVDTPPSGFTFDSASGATCTANGTVTCDLGTVAAGDTATFTITFDIDPSVLGTVTNDVTVASTTTDPNGDNNDASETTTVNTEADLSITKTGPGSAVPGTTVTFTVDVTNSGPSDARDVEVTEAPPPDYNFDSATAPCGGGFPCDLGTLSPGQTVSFEVTYAIDPGATGDVTNSVSVTTSATDPNGGNDSDSATTTMDPMADPAITKEADAQQAFEGQTFDYTLTVDNAGPSDATGVVITDNLPAGQALVSSSGCAEDPDGAPTCTVGTIAAGGSATVTLTVEVTAAQGQIANTASVDSNADDPTPADNSASVVVITVMPIPALGRLGLALLAAAMVGIALVTMRRRTRG